MLGAGYEFVLNVRNSEVNVCSARSMRHQAPSLGVFFKCAGARSETMYYDGEEKKEKRGKSTPHASILCAHILTGLKLCVFLQYRFRSQSVPFC